MRLVTYGKLPDRCPGTGKTSFRERHFLTKKLFLLCLIFRVNKILIFHICVAKERIPHRMVWPEQHGRARRLCLYSTLFFVVLIQLVNIKLAVTFFVKISKLYY